MAPLRVLIVDDEPDIRALIKAVLEFDGRYEVVGQAVDGTEGITMAEELQPDVVVLDKSMPRLNGLEALPRIQAVAPTASVVLYTAENDNQLHQAAVAGGAVDVITKDGHVTELAGALSEALLRNWAGDPSVRVGPVPSSAALAWITNTRRILDVVAEHPEITDRPVSRHVETICSYLDTWQAVAEASPEFVWAATTTADEVGELLEAWAAIDRIPEEVLAAHGLAWSTGEARSFFDALATAVAGALDTHQIRSSLRERLTGG